MNRKRWSVDYHATRHAHALVLEYYYQKAAVSDEVGPMLFWFILLYSELYNLGLYALSDPYYSGRILPFL